MGDEPPIMVDIHGEDLGLLIGSSGETLEALQFIARIMVVCKYGKRVNLVLDVDGYKVIREQQLQLVVEGDRADDCSERVVRISRVQVAQEEQPTFRRVVVPELVARAPAKVNRHRLRPGGSPPAACRGRLSRWERNSRD